ncbi:hypothetical protein HJC23_005411 [Cyclotella cryptica]|uniref:Uncharacterized protein n=1 Tax=Cyclotella cryptica TaxID=29204 RepID=A0ABD3P229_9STRA
MTVMHPVNECGDCNDIGTTTMSTTTISICSSNRLLYKSIPTWNAGAEVEDTFYWEKTAQESY